MVRQSWLNLRYSLGWESTRLRIGTWEGRVVTLVSFLKNKVRKVWGMPKSK